MSKPSRACALRARPFRLAITIAIVCATPLLVTATRAQDPHVLTDAKVGFELRYPDTWFVVTSTYRNATELRNHDESHAVAPSDEARILVSWEQPLSVEQAARRVEGLMESASRRPGYAVHKVEAAGHTLYQWTTLEPPAVPAIAGAEKPERMRVRVSSALVGVPLIRVDGTAWEDASAEVLAEMKKIALSIRALPGEGEGK